MPILIDLEEVLGPAWIESLQSTYRRQEDVQLRLKELLGEHYDKPKFPDASVWISTLPAETQEEISKQLLFLEALQGNLAEEWWSNNVSTRLQEAAILALHGERPRSLPDLLVRDLRMAIYGTHR